MPRTTPHHAVCLEISGGYSCLSCHIMLLSLAQVGFLIRLSRVMPWLLTEELQAPLSASTYPSRLKCFVPVVWLCPPQSPGRVTGRRLICLILPTPPLPQATQLKSRRIWSKALSDPLTSCMNKYSKEDEMLHVLEICKQMFPSVIIFYLFSESVSRLGLVYVLPQSRILALKVCAVSCWSAENKSALQPQLANNNTF